MIANVNIANACSWEPTRLHLNPPHTVGGAFDPTLPQCNALVRPNNEGIRQLQLAELTNLEPIALMRILNRMEFDG